MCEITPIEAEWEQKLKSSAYGQAHLLPSDASTEEKKRLIKDIERLNNSYPGGLLNYVDRSRKLLADCIQGVNPFDGCRPEVPLGHKLSFGSPEFDEMEELGAQQFGRCAFCLVAGGLGERLGYPDVKIGLPSETTTNTSYMELYCQYILAFQKKAAEMEKPERQLPLVIMTSDDTHERTQTLLRENSNFGMASGQITIIKQEKVPAVLDKDGRLAVSPEDKYRILTKPHGHGDVHTLLLQKGLCKKWEQEGMKWLVFFQDTNGLLFRGLPAVLGVSAKEGFVMNSITVPRKAGEAVGAICKLVKNDGSSLTLNVEYNQLDPLLKATSGKGDIGDENGLSQFPGNVNSFVVSLPRYSAVLEATVGTVPEFINPKFADSSKTVFKSAARLECMMQDFPRLLETNDKVGFTELERWVCFSAVKNNVADAVKKVTEGIFPECAFSAETDMYSNNTRFLEAAARAAGCEVSIAVPRPLQFLDIPCNCGPRVVLHPSFGVTLADMKRKFTGGSRLQIAEDATLVLSGDVKLNGLAVKGACILRATPGLTLVAERISVDNKGWELKKCMTGPVTTQMRGYSVSKIEGVELQGSGKICM